MKGLATVDASAHMDTASLSKTSLLLLQRPLLRMGYIMGFFPYCPAKTWSTLPFDFKLSYLARFRGLLVISGLFACLYLTFKFTQEFLKIEAYTNVNLCQAAFTTSSILPVVFAIISAINNSFYATTMLKNVMREMSNFSLPPDAFRKAKSRIMLVTIGVPATLVLGFVSGGLYTALIASGAMSSPSANDELAMDMPRVFWPQSVAGSVWILADVPVCVMFYAISCGMKALNGELEGICKAQMEGNRMSTTAAAALVQADDELEVWAQLRKLRLKYVKLCQLVRTQSKAFSAYTYCTCFGGGISLVINLFLLASSWSDISGEGGSTMLLLMLAMSVLLCWGRLVVICFMVSMPMNQVEDAQRILSLVSPKQGQPAVPRPDIVLQESPVMSGVAVFQQELEINQPLVTACNFFYVSRKTILSILAQTSSYLVILIQFYPQQSTNDSCLFHQIGNDSNLSGTVR